MSTLANFRTQVSQKLGMDNTAGSTEQGLIDYWVNQAIVDILMETEVYVVEAQATLTAGQGDYTPIYQLEELQTFVENVKTQLLTQQNGQGAEHNIPVPPVS
jgi:hypothetical protein